MTFPGVMGLGVPSSIAHCSMVRAQWLSAATSIPLHTFMVLDVSTGVPGLVYGVTGPIGWLFRCIKAWDGTFAHPVKVVLLVSYVICCSNSPFFFFYQTCCLWVIGELEPPFNVMFFCISWPLECNPLPSLSIRQGCPYIVLSFSDPLMVGSLVCVTTGESLG